MNMATRPAAAVEEVKSIMGAKARPATARMPSPRKKPNSFLRMPRISPNTPRKGAASATMAMAMLVA